MTDGLSVADAMALSNRNNDGFGEGGGFIAMMAMFFLFSMFGWGGYGGFGGFGGWGRGNDAAAWNGALTRGELCQDMNFQTMGNGIRGIQNGLCDGFYAQNTTMLNGINSIQRDLCTGFSSTGAAVNQARFDAKECCCETNRNIDAVRYENAKNTCDIIKSNDAGVQKILDALCGNRMADMQNQINQLQLQAMLAGVVRYPSQTTYTAGYSPCFNGGYGNGGCNYCGNI